MYNFSATLFSSTGAVFSSCSLFSRLSFSCFFICFFSRLLSLRRKLVPSPKPTPCAFVLSSILRSKKRPSRSSMCQFSCTSSGFSSRPNFRSSARSVHFFIINYLEQFYINKKIIFIVYDTFEKIYKIKLMCEQISCVFFIHWKTNILNLVE